MKTIIVTTLLCAGATVVMWVIAYRDQRKTKEKEDEKDYPFKFP